MGIFPSQIINENKTLTLKCQLTNIEIAVKDEADVLLPLVNITIKPARAEAESFETKSIESIKLRNMFTDINYTIEARRYGFLFNTTFIEKLSAKPWNNITITCPTYTTSIHVLDSKGEVLPNVQVSLTEWSSWSVLDGGTTDNQGNIDLSATFGRYKVRVYNYSTMLGTEVVLNETIVDLIEDWMPIVIRCNSFNVDLSVKTVDYFGQPIPNAVVEVEKKVGQDWVRIDRLTTDLDGLISLNNIVGGDLRISVQLAEKLLGIKQLHLDESKQILFKIDDHTVVGGYSVEVIQLITFVSIALLVVVFGLALTYKRLFQRFAEKTKAESKKQKSL